MSRARNCPVTCVNASAGRLRHLRKTRNQPAAAPLTHRHLTSQLKLRSGDCVSRPGAWCMLSMLPITGSGSWACSAGRRMTTRICRIWCRSCAPDHPSGAALPVVTLLRLGRSSFNLHTNDVRVASQRLWPRSTLGAHTPVDGTRRCQQLVSSSTTLPKGCSSFGGYGRASRITAPSLIGHWPPWCIEHVKRRPAPHHHFLGERRIGQAHRDPPRRKSRNDSDDSSINCDARLAL
jgi:hypothetical protein